MKKPLPVGNLIDRLINESIDDYTDVPNVPFNGDFKTQVPLAGLPKGGYGYTKGDTYNEDDEIPIGIPKKKKRKFIEELPPKDNYEEGPEEVEFKDKKEINWDDSDDETDEDFETNNSDSISDDEDEIPEDWFDDDEEEITEQKKVDPEKEEDPNSMIDPGGTGGADDSEEIPDETAEDASGEEDMADYDPAADPEMTGEETAEEDPSAAGQVDMNADPNAMPETGMETDPAAGGGDMTGMDPAAGGDMSGGMGADPSMGGAAGGMDPSMGGDPNAMGGMGMPGEEAPKTAEEIGRIFELKKIYSRLLAVEQHLSFSSDELLLKLRDFVSQTIELFETLISNIDSFKDQIDEVIVMFYKFLEYVYSIMNRYYKIKEKQDAKQNDETKLFTKFPTVKDGDKNNKTPGTFMLRLSQGGM